jgi:hypothetical protein
MRAVGFRRVENVVKKVASVTRPATVSTELGLFFARAHFVKRPVEGPLSLFKSPPQQLPDP